MTAEYQQLEDKLDQILQRISTIETVVARQSDLCPHRELLARAANNIVRMDRMEGVVTALRLEMARIGAIAGGISGLSGAIISAVVMKALGI
jgi:hypothetical protein